MRLRGQDHPALQAADLLAYVTYQLTRHKYRNVAVELGVAHCITRLGSFRRKPDMHSIDRARIDEWLSRIEQPIRDGAADKRRP
jgi:hypothetical protein